MRRAEATHRSRSVSGFWSQSFKAQTAEVLAILVIIMSASARDNTLLALSDERVIRKNAWCPGSNRGYMAPPL